MQGGLIMLINNSLVSLLLGSGSSSSKINVDDINLFFLHKMFNDAVEVKNKNVLTQESESCLKNVTRDRFSEPTFAELLKRETQRIDREDMPFVPEVNFSERRGSFVTSRKRKDVDICISNELKLKYIAKMHNSFILDDVSKYKQEDIKQIIVSCLKCGVTYIIFALSYDKFITMKIHHEWSNPSINNYYIDSYEKNSRGKIFIPRTVIINSFDMSMESLCHLIGISVHGTSTSSHVKPYSAHIFANLIDVSLIIDSCNVIMDENSAILKTKYNLNLEKYFSFERACYFYVNNGEDKIRRSRRKNLLQKNELVELYCRFIENKSIFDAYNSLL